MKILIGYSNVNFPSEILGVNRVEASLSKEHSLTYIEYDSFDEFVENNLIGEFNVIIITVSLQFVEVMLDIVKWIKLYASTAYIVVVYPYAISPHDIFHEIPEIDLVVPGLAELVLPELFQNITTSNDIIEKAKKNIYVWVNGADNSHKIEKKGDFSLTPLPITRKSSFRRNGYAAIQSSFGCRANCSFCLSKGSGNNWSAKTPNEIVEEIWRIYQCYHNAHFVFADRSFEDSLNNDKQRILEFCDLLKQLPVQLTYRCYLRAESFSQPSDIVILQEMKATGFCNILVGVEAFTQDELKLFNKIAKVEDNNRSLKTLKNIGFFTEIGNIMLHPLTTLESLSINLCALQRHTIFSLYSYYSLLYIYKGSLVYNRLTEYLKDYDYKNPTIYQYKHKEIQTIDDFIRKYFLKSDLESMANTAQKELYSINVWLRILEYEGVINVHPFDSKVAEIQKRLANILGDYFAKIYKDFDMEMAKAQLGSLDNMLREQYAIIDALLKKIYMIVIKNVGDKYRIY